MSKSALVWGLLRDCENRWIVYSSNEDLQAGASLRGAAVPHLHPQPGLQGAGAADAAGGRGCADLRLTRLLRGEGQLVFSNFYIDFHNMQIKIFIVGRFKDLC